MEIKASDVKKYVEDFGNYFKNISDEDLQSMIKNMNNIKSYESFNKHDFLYYKNDYIKHMSKEKNMTVKEYNDKYITLIGECCALNKTGFISVEKNQINSQVCNYIEYLEQQCRKQKEVIDKLVEVNQIINNSDYVYSQDEITSKNLDILKEVSE